MSKKKIITLALVAIVAITAIASASLAYFTDTKTADNTFMMGNVKITLDEAPVNEEGKATDGNRVTGNDYGIDAVYPGATLDKDPTVHNVGKNPAYIRATINVSDWRNICAAFYPEYDKHFMEEGYEQSLMLLVDELGEGWSIVGVTAGDTFALGALDAKFVLKYDGVLAAGEDTTPMFRHVMIPTSVGESNGYATPLFDSFKEIKITAQAIQANGFDSWEAAFAAFDA